MDTDSSSEEAKEFIFDNDQISPISDILESNLPFYYPVPESYTGDFHRHHVDYSINENISDTSYEEDVPKNLEFRNQPRFYMPLEEKSLYKNQSEPIDEDLTKRVFSIFPTTSQSSQVHEGDIITIETHPLDHQVKECLIVPHPVIRILCSANTSDYIAVFLECDKRMNLDPIFLGAQSAKFCKDNTIAFDNLKITNKMLKGRTKGFTFVLRFEYISNSVRICHINSNQINLWTHVGQKGFPREIRDKFQKRWKDSKYKVE